MKLINCNVLVIVMALVFGGSSDAIQYEASEVCLIKWGDAADQLKILTPYSDYDTSMGPIESLYTDSWTYTDGPTQAIVDKNENVYAFSYGLDQFKGFDRNGNLLFNYSSGESQFWKSEFGNCNISTIYVDSLERIYINFFPRLWYIGVIDKNEHVIDKLYPMGKNSEYGIVNIWPGSKDILSIMLESNQGKYFTTYKNNRFISGGNDMWLADDGYYYYACYYDSLSLKFFKGFDPDTNSNFDSIQTSIVSLSTLVFGSSFIGVDDSLYKFVMVGWESEDRPSVLVYNLKNELVYQIIPPEYTNKYQWRMGYWLHPNGDVYEFRCLDDGLHVIKWSKQ